MENPTTEFASLIQSILLAGQAGEIERARRLARDRFHFEPREATARRQISYAIQAKLFARDGYRCRYFGDRLLFPGVLLLLEKLFPVEFPADEGYRVSKSHWIYWYVWPVLDHRNAVAGGEQDPNRESNLVTTSTFRNVQKGSWTLDQMGWRDRGSPESEDEWDGMVGWFRNYMRTASQDVWNHRNIRVWCKAIGIESAKAPVDVLSEPSSRTTDLP